MTLKQLEAEISLRLEKYLVDPQVTLPISEFRSHPISVMGTVTRPGVLQVRGPWTLWEINSDSALVEIQQMNPDFLNMRQWTLSSRPKATGTATPSRRSSTSCRREA